MNVGIPDQRLFNGYISFPAISVTIKLINEKESLHAGLTFFLSLLAIYGQNIVTSN